MLNLTEEQKGFLNDYIPGHHYYEVAAAIKEKYGVDMSIGQVKSYCRRKGVHTGFSGQYKKGNNPIVKYPNGNCPENTKEIGSERKDKNYIKIKVGQPKKWVLKHRFIYEQHHGKIPDTYRVIFADGNTENFSDNNLICISPKVGAVMAKYKFYSDNPDITKAGVRFAELIVKIKEKEKK